MKKQTTITSVCQSNGGINDRLAFVLVDSAECYFNLLFTRLYDNKPIGLEKCNTETYFKVRQVLHTSSLFLSCDLEVVNLITLFCVHSTCFQIKN